MNLETTNRNSFTRSFEILSPKIVLATVFFVLIFFGYLLRDYAIDDSYITFRHADNLVRGFGFVFNPGERLLSTTAPLQGLILAAFRFVYLGEIKHYANALSTLGMIGICFGVLYVFSVIDKLFAGIWSVLLILSQQWFYRFFSLETMFVLGLCLIALAFIFRANWIMAGFFSGLAIVTRPDAILFVFAIIIFQILFWGKIQVGLVKFSISCGLISLLWFGPAFFYYGSPFPNTLAAKSGFEYVTFIRALWPKILSQLVWERKFWSALLVGFGIGGMIIALLKKSPLGIFPVWGSFYIAGYSLLQIIFAFSWYYAPIILITLIMAGYFVQEFVDALFLLLTKILEPPTLKRYLPPMMAAGILIFPISLSIAGSFWFITTYQSDYFGGARDNIYRNVGLWLRDNTTHEATIASSEIGSIGYYSDRYIIDVLGLATPELTGFQKLAVQTKDWKKAVQLTSPDYVIGVRNQNLDRDLSGIDGYTFVKCFPFDGVNNLFQDIVIYRRLDIRTTIPEPSNCHGLFR